MTKPLEPQVVTIPDSPAETDFFGGHDRVADAIYSLVVTEPTGLTVGLEGAWGSGKSTVVALLQKKLSDSNVNVFVYDTWAHEGDPLRRSFLESLIGALLENEWLVDRPKWERQLKTLAHRRRETEQTTTTKLRPFGRVLAIVAPLVPLGLLLTATGIDRENAWLQLVGVVLALSPLVAAFGFWGFTAVRHRWGSSEHDEGTSRHRFGIFEQETDTTQTTNTIETPDPTSIEFQTVFTMLLGEALGSSERRLLIVLDNLDRVRADTAEQTISTLQPFIGGGHREPARSQLWVLIPYNRHQINKLSGAQNREPLGTTEHLLDKLFDVRYDTPPLIVSDWRSFMNDCLRQALPSTDPDDLEQVTAVVAAARLDLHSTQGGDQVGASWAPTPRQVIQIVNRLGGMYRQWSNSLPLAHLGYFAYLRHRDIAVDIDLLAGTLPSERAGRLLGSTVRDSLAMLHFNVELDRARQVLLFEPLMTALLTGDDERTQVLAQIPGFWTVAEAMPFHGWAQRGGQDLAQAGATLTAAGVLHGATRSVLDQVTAALRSADSWELSGRDAGKGLAALALSVVTEPSELQDLARSVLPSHDEETESSELEGRIRAVVAFVEELTSDPKRRLTVEDLAIDVPGPATSYLQVCALLASEDPEGRFWRAFRTSASDKELTEALNAMGQGVEVSDVANIYRVLATQVQQPDWSQVALEASSRISQSSAHDGGLAVSIRAMASLSELGLTDPADLITQGQVMRAFELAAAAGDKVAIEAAFLQLTHNLPLSSLDGTVGQTGRDQLIQIFNNRKANPTVFDGLGKRILEHNPEVHFEIVDELGVNPWSVSWIKELVDREGGIRADHLVAHWSPLSRALEEDDIAELITRHLSDAAFSAAIDSSASRPAPPDMLRRVLESLDEAEAVSDQTRLDIRRIVNGHLSKLTTDGWGAELRGDGEWLALLRKLPSGFPNLGVAYREALRDHAVAVAQGNTQVADLEGWKAVLEALDPSLISQLATSVLSELYRLNQAPAPAFWDVYGPLLASDPEVHEQTILLDMIQDAVRRADSPSLRWAVHMLRANSTILESKQSTTRVDSMRGLVAESLASDSSEELRDLAQELGVESNRKSD